MKLNVNFLILKLAIPVTLALLFNYFLVEKLSIVSNIIILLLTWLIILTYEIINYLIRQKNEVEANIGEIRTHIDEIRNVYPFDAIEKIKNFNNGRINNEQESIVNLLGTLYEELVLEGKMKREKHIQAVRYIYLNKEIKKFINKVREGVSDNTLTFGSPNSINVTKDLYGLDDFKKLDAISYPSLEFWKSRQGEQFLNRNKQAILEDKITINRYFIVNDTSSINEAKELSKTLSLHKKFKEKYQLKDYNIYLVKRFKGVEIKNILGSSKELKFSKKPNSEELQIVPDTSLISDKIVSIWNFGSEPSDLDEVRLIVKRTTVEKIRSLFTFFYKIKIVLPEKIDHRILLKLYNTEI